MEATTLNHSHNTQQPIPNQTTQAVENQEQETKNQEFWRPSPDSNPRSLTLDSITTVTMPVLSPGNNGEAVRFLQQMLISLGYHIVQFNANFDRYTYQGVIEFQWQHGLRPDGVVGWHTWRQLGEEIVSRRR